MKIVIQTQFMENYAWNEDGSIGTGTDAYWKYKGGDTYIVDATVEQAQASTFWSNLEAHIEYSNDMAQEYILGMEVIDECDFKLEDHIQEWEAPIYLTAQDDGFVATKTTENGEFGYMRSEIKTKIETWTVLPENDRDNYTSQFVMEDNSVIPYKQLESYLKAA
jgi:hypothetical protein